MITCWGLVQSWERCQQWLSNVWMSFTYVFMPAIFFPFAQFPTKTVSIQIRVFACLACVKLKVQVVPKQSSKKDKDNLPQRNNTIFPQLLKNLLYLVYNNLKRPGENEDQGVQLSFQQLQHQAVYDCSSRWNRHQTFCSLSLSAL